MNQPEFKIITVNRTTTYAVTVPQNGREQEILRGFAQVLEATGYSEPAILIYERIGDDVGRITARESLRNAGDGVQRERG